MQNCRMLQSPNLRVLQRRVLLQVVSDRACAHKIDVCTHLAPGSNNRASGVRAVVALRRRAAPSPVPQVHLGPKNQATSAQRVPDVTG